MPTEWPKRVCHTLTPLLSSLCRLSVGPGQTTPRPSAVHCVLLGATLHTHLRFSPTMRPSGLLLRVIFLLSQWPNCHYRLFLSFSFSDFSLPPQNSTRAGILLQRYHFYFTFYNTFLLINVNSIHLLPYSPLLVNTQ